MITRASVKEGTQKLPFFLSEKDHMKRNIIRVTDKLQGTQRRCEFFVFDDVATYRKICLVVLYEGYVFEAKKTITLSFIRLKI